MAIMTMAVLKKLALPQPTTMARIPAISHVKQPPNRPRRQKLTFRQTRRAEAGTGIREDVAGPTRRQRKKMAAYIIKTPSNNVSAKGAIKSANRSPSPARKIMIHANIDDPNATATDTRSRVLAHR